MAIPETDDCVVCRLGGHQQRLSCDLCHLGDPLRVHKLLVGVVRDLVVDGCEMDRLSPGEAHGMGRHFCGSQVENNVAGLDLLLHTLGQATQAVSVRPKGNKKQSLKSEISPRHREFLGDSSHNYFSNVC